MPGSYNQLLEIQERTNSIGPDFGYLNMWYKIYVVVLSKTVEISDPYKAINFLGDCQKLYKDYIKKLIFERDRTICMICGIANKNGEWHIDHIIPKSKFPISHPWNLQILCVECNLKKRDDLLNAVPLFIEGARLRTTELFPDENINEMYEVLSDLYQTPTVERKPLESFFDKIIETESGWASIKAIIKDFSMIWMKR